MKRNTNIFVILSMLLISVIAVAVFAGKVENRTSAMLGREREDVLLDRRTFSDFTEELSKFFVRER